MRNGLHNSALSIKSNRREAYTPINHLESLQVIYSFDTSVIIGQNGNLIVTKLRVFLKLRLSIIICGIIS